MSAKTSKAILTFGLVAAMLIGMTFIMSGSTFAAVAAPIAGVAQPTINQPAAPQAAPMPMPPAGSEGGLLLGSPFLGGVNPFFGGFGLNPFFGGFGFNPFFNDGFID